MMLSTLLQCCIVIVMQIKLTVVVVVVVVVVVTNISTLKHIRRVERTAKKLI